MVVLNNLRLLMLPLLFGIFVISERCFCGNQEHATNDTEFLKLIDWEYYQGDIEQDSSGLYLFPPRWTEIVFWKKTTESLLPNTAKKTLWLRTKLPPWNRPSQALFVNMVQQEMQVFCEGKLIFDNRTYLSASSNKEILGFRWYLIKLNDHCSEQYLYFRFFSESSEIGLASPVAVGSLDYFYQEIISGNIYDMIMGSIILLAACVMLAMFLFVRKTQFYLGLTIFFFATSISVSFDNPYIYLLIHNTRFVVFVDNFVYFFFAGIFVSLEEMVLPRFKIIVRRVWQIHAGYIIFAVVVLLLTRYTVVDLKIPFLILQIITSNLVVVLLFRSLSLKKIDHLILVVGTAIFSALSSVEILHYYYYLINRTDALITKTYVMHWGIFQFVISLIVLGMYRYVNEEKQKREAEQKSVQQQQLAVEAMQREVDTRERYTHQLLQSQDEERKRIALELHDAIGQELLIIKNMALLWLKAKRALAKKNRFVEYIEDISTTTTSVIESVRNLSRNLHPYQLDDLGLTEALEAIVDRMENKTNIHFKYTIDSVDGLFEREHELHLYRIVQELLNNILKHSKATQAEIRVKQEHHTVTITAHDNGKGFSQQKYSGAAHKYHTGLGITGMNERVNILKGSITIESKLNKGTSVKVEIPIPCVEQP